MEVVPISGHQNHHKAEYINQAQHKSSTRVKTKIENFKLLHTHIGVGPMSMHCFTAIVVDDFSSDSTLILTRAGDRDQLYRLDPTE
jgi:hypothetical protein